MDSPTSSSSATMAAIRDDLKAVADELDRRWAGSPARAHFIARYYLVTQTAFVAALKPKRLLRRGDRDARGTCRHVALAGDKPGRWSAPTNSAESVRRRGWPLGVHGDPTHASAQLGQMGVDMIVAQTTAAIRAAVGRY